MSALADSGLESRSRGTGDPRVFWRGQLSSYYSRPEKDVLEIPGPVHVPFLKRFSGYPPAPVRDWYKSKKPTFITRIFLSSIGTRGCGSHMRGGTYSKRSHVERRCSHLGLTQSRISPSMLQYTKKRGRSRVGSRPSRCQGTGVPRA